ncbi:hypothetical protein DRB17_14565 [Ferruginivarius sediminum]|uniref:Uncharacterized protein n=1 Tax=Ferruginivarius sediminum TaxID=2661937 RepID=A0A369T708_9PROT|nr:hypothetical protein DRB17_14565 [Ferruginivarius sediminum]
MHRTGQRGRADRRAPGARQRGKEPCRPPEHRVGSRRASGGPGKSTPGKGSPPRRKEAPARRSPRESATGEGSAARRTGAPARRGPRGKARGRIDAGGGRRARPARLTRVAA